MLASVRLAFPSLCLAILGCQPSEGTEADLASRLEQIDQRLATVETRVQAIADWTAAQDAQQAKAQAEHEARVAEAQARQAEQEAEREAARAEREEYRRALRDRFGNPDDADYDPLTGPEPLVGSSREIAGAAEAIACIEPSVGRIECTMDRAFLEHLMDDPALLTKQARVVPSQRDGKIVGFKVYGIRRGSLPKLLGLKNGDMITKVNGLALGGMEEAMSAYAKLRGVRQLDIEIDRRGVLVLLVLKLVR